MRQIVTTLLIIITIPIQSFSQTRIYRGHIDKYPIHLLTDTYEDRVSAIYFYDKYDTPIIIDGTQKGDSLILIEEHEKGESKLEFIGFEPDRNEIAGKWISEDGQTIFDIKLTKLVEFNSYDDTAFEGLEFMQAESTDDYYFNLIISKEAKRDIYVTGIRIYEKKTDRLIQELEMECLFREFHNVSIGDYNFDGINDFSVFESYYAGPNTSCIYVLKDPKSEKYFISGISGTSLSFDHEAKLIYEHNQCCAGRMHTNATYKLVDNEMVLIEETCWEYDEEKDDFVECE